MTLLLIAGRLWREIPSTGGWYTLDEVAPGLYAYRYSDDPSQGEPSPAHRGQVEAETSDQSLRRWRAPRARLG